MIKPGEYKPAIVRQEIDDEHFYFVDGEFFPSVTRILQETLPMPYALRQWIGDVGNERAQAKLETAGNRGTALHDACERLLNGMEIELKAEFPGKSEQKALVGFVNWAAIFKPTLASASDIEFTIASQSGYAGTLDVKCQIDPDLIFKNTKYKTTNPDWIIDIKTSAGVYDSHLLQISAYQGAYLEMTGTACNRGILHLNTRTKAGFSFWTDDKIKIKGAPVTQGDFLKVFELYKVLNGGKIEAPALVDVYPDKLSLKGGGNGKN